MITTHTTFRLALALGPSRGFLDTSKHRIVRDSSRKILHILHIELRRLALAYFRKPEHFNTVNSGGNFSPNRSRFSRREKSVNDQTCHDENLISDSLIGLNIRLSSLGVGQLSISFLVVGSDIYHAVINHFRWYRILY